MEKSRDRRLSEPVSVKVQVCCFMTKSDKCFLGSQWLSAPSTMVSPLDQLREVLYYNYSTLSLAGISTWYRGRRCWRDSYSFGGGGNRTWYFFCCFLMSTWSSCSRLSTGSGCDIIGFFFFFIPYWPIFHHSSMHILISISKMFFTHKEHPIFNPLYK